MKRHRRSLPRRVWGIGWRVAAVLGGALVAAIAILILLDARDPYGGPIAPPDA